MVLAGIQYLLLGLYLIVPVAAVFHALRRWRQGARSALAGILLTYLGGIGIGIVILLLNNRLMGGRIAALESMRLIYFIVSAMCLLRIVDRFLLRSIFHFMRIALDRHGRVKTPHQPRALLILIGQRTLMMGIVVAYVFSLMLTYRPKVVYDRVSPSMLRLDHVPVRFTAADRTRVAGWWIPARPEPAGTHGEAADQWGQRTVLLCHGVGAGKEHMLGLAWLLASRGYNVMAFDFRGHGGTGGNFISYGDRERQEVLAALAWVKANHPLQAQRVYGLGMNMGAAALLAAAAEPRGEQIDALVLYEPYARFQSLANHTAQRILPRGVAWVFERFSLPIASLHAGADLASFSPAEHASRIWPRPVLVVHGRGETFVPASEGIDLYHQAMFPKEQFWPSDTYLASRARLRRLADHHESIMLIHMFRDWLGTQHNLTSDPGAQYRTLKFLRAAEPVPVL
jgi:uncharacterized protein